ncbi:MAG: hypothetical protein ACP5MD_13770, partial [Verrucomicrobiia bacterium]
MRVLDRCEEVRGLAAAMGVSAARGAVAGLLAHCRSRVGRWVVEAGGGNGHQQGGRRLPDIEEQV